MPTCSRADRGRFEGTTTAKNVPYRREGQDHRQRRRAVASHRPKLFAQDGGIQVARVRRALGRVPGLGAHVQLPGLSVERFS